MINSLRPPTAAEWPFVLSGWIRSSLAFLPCRVWREGDGVDHYVQELGKGRLHTKRMPRDRYCEQLKARIARLQCDGRSEFRVAEMAGALLGFCVYAPGVVHYLYVDGKFRRRGVMTEMLTRSGFPARGPLTVTHWTPVVEQCFAAYTWDETSLEAR